MYLIILLISLLLYFRKDKYLSLLGFFFLLTDGFQFLPEQVPFLSFGYLGKDFALLYIIFLNIFNLLLPGQRSIKAGNGLRILLLCYAFYLIIAMAIDLAVNHTPIGDFLLMTRHYFFLLALTVVNKFSLETYTRMGKTLLVFTVIQAVLCIMQIPLGIKLLFGGNIGEYDEYGLSWIRYTNVPFMAYFFFFYLFMYAIKEKQLKYKYAYLGLITLSIFLTLTRTLILGIILSLAIALLLRIWKLNARMIVLIAMMVVLLLPVLKERVASSFTDIEAAADEGSDDRKLTFTYRMAHAAERIVYISNSTRTFLLGIGFIHERSFPPTTFLLGIRLDDGYSIQLEQDDIAWSNLILRNGLIGTVLYFLIYAYLTSFFYRNRKIFISAIAFMLMIFHFFLTFASGKFSFADFYIIPFILYFIVKGLKNESYSASFNYYPLV